MMVLTRLHMPSEAVLWYIVPKKLARARDLLSLLRDFALVNMALLIDPYRGGTEGKGSDSHNEEEQNPDLSHGIA